MKVFSIAVVIVTYNRLDELGELFYRLSKLTDVNFDIVLVDNNSKENLYSALLNDYQNELNINYIKLNENQGGAGGFYHGLKYSFDKGYDLFWLMDDDGYPLDSLTLKTLVEKAKDVSRFHKLFILNSLVLSDNDTLAFGIRGKQFRSELSTHSGCLILGDVNPFNGTLISRETVIKIGYPRVEYFIKGDESEYIYRALKNDVILGTVIDSLFYHPKNMEFRRVKYLGFNVFIEPPWKFYFRVRNYTRTAIDYRNYRFVKTVIIWGSQCLFMGKFKYITFYIRGLFDGIFNRMGNRIKI